MRASPTHELSLRTLGDFIGLQFGLVGFVLLPVVLSGVALTAWRGYRTPRAGRDPAVDRRARAVRLFPLEVADAAGRRHLADVHVAGRFRRRRHQHRDAAARRLAGLDDPVDVFWARTAIVAGVAFVVAVFLYYVAAPWNFIGRTDPIGGEAGYEQVVARAQAADAKDRRDLDRDHGLSHLCDAALVFQDRVPVIQINERGRFLGFRDPGMDRIRVMPASMSRASPTTLAALERDDAPMRRRSERVERSWRGVVMDTYALEKLTGWTPELSPPPDSPLLPLARAGQLPSSALGGGREAPDEGFRAVRVTREIDEPLLPLPQGESGIALTPRRRASATDPWRDRPAPAAAAP